MNDTSTPGVDWIEWAEAARRNAVEYVKDAEALVGSRRYARAYAAAVLGLEEVGKFYLCLNAPLAESTGFGGPNAVRTIRQQLGNHLAKLSAAGAAIALYSETFAPTNVIDRLQRFVEVESATKFRGLYADWEDDAVSEPSQVTETDAKNVVTLLADLVSFVAQLDPRLLPERLQSPEFMNPITTMLQGIDAFRDHVNLLDESEREQLIRTVIDELVPHMRDSFALDDPAAESSEDNARMPGA